MYHDMTIYRYIVTSLVAIAFIIEKVITHLTLIIRYRSWRDLLSVVVILNCLLVITTCDNIIVYVCISNYGY